MNFSIFDNEETFAGVEDVSLFSFQWIDVGVEEWFSDWRSTHGRFNRAFVQAFPKLLYTVPYSNYTAGGLQFGGQLAALGESRMSPSQTRARVEAIARQAGFMGRSNNIVFGQKTVGELERGATITIPRSTETGFRVWARTTDAFFRDLVNKFPKLDIGILTIAVVGLGIVLLTRD